MKKRKIGALTLSVVLASAICVPATAFADNYNGSDQATKDSAGTGATSSAPISSTGTETTVTGKIKATTLSVSIPTAVAFNVDPGAAQAVTDAAAGDTGGGATVSNKHGQFTSPTNYKVSNLSRVKVYAYISGVAATAAGTPGTTVTPSLVATAPTYGGSNHADMMIGIKSAANAPTDFTTAGDWLTTSLATNYYPFNGTNKGEIAASTNGTTAAESDAMMIYGQVDQAGWTDGDSFQIKPTFTVTSTKPA